jgi:hypoxanthine phosphoribosyltransferase
MTSSGTVVVNSSLPELAGRHVIIVEDIVDSGLTIERLAADVRVSGAQSVAIATLLSKPDVHKHRVALDYVGREIGSEFVVGYGLDYAEYGRELDAIWVVDDSGIDSQ